LHELSTIILIKDNTGTDIILVSSGLILNSMTLLGSPDTSASRTRISDLKSGNFESQSGILVLKPRADSNELKH
jgi:hypothetical protein